MAYGGLRVGFARLRIAASENLGGGGWIARDRNVTESPLGVSRDLAFVISPKTGLLFGVGGRTALDLSVQPLFILDHGQVNTQITITMSLPMSAWQVF